MDARGVCARACPPVLKINLCCLLTLFTLGQCICSFVFHCRFVSLLLLCTHTHSGECKYRCCPFEHPGRKTEARHPEGRQPPEEKETASQQEKGPQWVRACNRWTRQAPRQKSQQRVERPPAWEQRQSPPRNPAPEKQARSRDPCQRAAAKRRPGECAHPEPPLRHGRATPAQPPCRGRARQKDSESRQARRHPRAPKVKGHSEIKGTSQSLTSEEGGSCRDSQGPKAKNSTGKEDTSQRIMRPTHTHTHTHKRTHTHVNTRFVFCACHSVHQVVG